MNGSGNYTEGDNAWYRNKVLGGRTYRIYLYTRCVYDIWYWGDAPMTNAGGTATAVKDADGNVTGYTGAATQWLGYKMD